MTRVPGEEEGKQRESVQEKLEQTGQHVRAQLTEAIETVKQRVTEQKEQVQAHLRQGLGGGKQLGRPPSGRPPTGRPPTGRPPTGRPPSRE